MVSSVDLRKMIVGAVELFHIFSCSVCFTGYHLVIVEFMHLLAWLFLFSLAESFMTCFMSASQRYCLKVCSFIFLNNFIWTVSADEVSLQIPSEENVGVHLILIKFHRQLIVSSVSCEKNFWTMLNYTHSVTDPAPHCLLPTERGLYRLSQRWFI